MTRSIPVVPAALTAALLLSASCFGTAGPAVELGEPDPDDPSRRKLTQHELATRMSFFLVDTIPDAELLDAIDPAKDVDGLLLAGRCISGDFIAHSSYRVTGNSVALGEAAGAGERVPVRGDPQDQPEAQQRDAQHRHAQRQLARQPRRLAAQAGPLFQPGAGPGVELMLLTPGEQRSADVHGPAMLAIPLRPGRGAPRGGRPRCVRWHGPIPAGPRRRIDSGPDKTRREEPPACR